MDVLLVKMPREPGTIDFFNEHGTDAIQHATRRVPQRRLERKRMLLLDRDTRFTAEFVPLLEASGVRCLPLPYRSPNLDAYAERFVLSIKSDSIG